MARMLHSASHLFASTRRLAGDERGFSAILTALAATVLMGFAGLAVDVGYWQMNQRNMQGAADQAAFAAATQAEKGATSSTAITTADGVAASMGFTNGASGVTVTVNNPPASGTYSGNASAYEVIITQPQPMWFANLIMSSTPTARGRAVGLGGSVGNGCVLALDTSSVVDVTASGGITQNLQNCSIYVNSPASNALTMSGGAVIDATSAFISGSDQISGGTTALTTTAGTHTGVAPIADPYLSVPIPTYSSSACPGTSTIAAGGTHTYTGGTKSLNISGGATVTLTPTAGIFVMCGGVVLSGGSSLTLNPGIYIIDKGSFNISGGTTVNGTGGVTIVFTSDSGTSYATASISGGAIVNITAPTTGSTAGMAFFQDRNAPSSGTDAFSGGATQNITGAIYFPHQTVNYSGGTATGGSACTQLIAYHISFSGGSTFKNNCAGVGTATIGGTTATKVVE